MLPPLPPPDDDRRNPHLGAALAALAGRVPPERVDQVWIFPPRRAGAKESGLAVLSLFEEGDGERRRRAVLTLRYEAEALKGGRTQRAEEAVEEGSVPVDRVARIIDGVVRRLETEGEAPDAREVGGDPAAWAALLAALGAPAAATVDGWQR